MAKAAAWACSDAEARKRGERTGLDTPVVLAVNAGCWVLGPEFCSVRSAQGNPLSTPPGEYGRKAETQRN